MKGSIIHLHSSSFSFISQNKRLCFLGASFGALITYVIAQELEKKMSFYHSPWISEGLTLIFCIIGKSCIWDAWRHRLARCILFQQPCFLKLLPCYMELVYSLSLSFISYSKAAMERSCVSQRVPWFWFSSVIVYTLFDWGVLLIMFSPYDRTFFEHEAGMLQWNMQLARCKSIFSIFYHHRLFNKIDFTGRSILWPVIYKYMWARNLRTVDK